MKKGQVTIFVIIAILVIAGIIVLALAMNNKKEVGDQFKMNSNNIKAYIDSCIKETSIDGTFFIAIQGGYYKKPENSKNYLFFYIPYYWYKNKEAVPELKVLESELSSYIDDNLPGCINNLEIFKDSGYTFDLKNPSSSVKINEKNIDIEINYPIVITKGSSSIKLEQFQYSFDSDLKKAYDYSKLIIEEQKKTPNSVPLSYIISLANEKGFNFEKIYIEDDDVIYTLVFDDNKDNENKFSYAFVSDYNWKNGVNKTL